ncbi:ABC transporter permease subunit [Halococcus sp. IIIV-5B]|uniref:ABC transporter permease subunit n=1 Tax=Halococcus sp. IIIV-5B TaxID=2321230 RepID=UPI001F2AAA37|nr:ABC transporter permease subunit [Halococcus sp. IIIV-5B]
MNRVRELVEAYTNITPNQPIYVQYVDYVTAVLQGDFGQSISFQEPVVSILLQALPWTLFVLSVSVLVSFTLSISLGAIMAYKEKTALDIGLSTYTTISSSIPYYIAGILMLYFFGYQLELFPTSGRVDASIPAGFNVDFVVSILHHAALPILSFVLTGLGATLSMRANSIRVLGEDYIHVAQLRGLSPRLISLRYVGRNAILPLYTGLLLTLALMLGGSVVMEQVFRYPGIGYFLIEAIRSRDYPLMMGGFLLISVGVTASMFIADLTYGLIDPRTSSEGNGNNNSSSVALLRLVRRQVRRVLKSSSESDQFIDGGTSSINDQSSQEGDTSLEKSVFQFEGEQDASTSLRERLFRMFDVYIYAPFMVLWDDIRGKIGILILAIYIIAGSVGVWLVTPPSVNEGPAYVLPFQNSGYPFGTDNSGIDLFAQMVHATPTMFQMILAGAIFATGMAMLIGTLSGFKGGFVDSVLMTLSDISIAIPGLPLIIVLAAIFQPQNPILVGIILTVNAWGGTARAIRSQVLTIREESYVEASRTMSTPTSTIISSDIVPNVAPYILIQFVEQSRAVIFGSVALYFLGVLPFTTTSNWGVVLNQAYSQGGLLTLATIHWILVPVVTIMLLSMALTLIAQAADALTSPQVRARHAKTTDENTEAEPTKV